MSTDTARDLRPLYAAAGLTDLIAETLRHRLERGQHEAAQRWNDLVQSPPRMPVALSPATRQRITDLQNRAGRVIADAETTYNQLAGRGKGAVDDAVGSARAFGQDAGGRLLGTVPAPFDRATELLRPITQRWLDQVPGVQSPQPAAADADSSAAGGSRPEARSTSPKSTASKSTSAGATTPRSKSTGSSTTPASTGRSGRSGSGAARKATSTARSAKAGSGGSASTRRRSAAKKSGS